MGALLSPLATLATSVIDRVLPDKAAQDAGKLELAKMQLSGELDQQLSAIADQLAVDKTEAASNSMFVAGWRPWVGWVCGVAMGYEFIGQPVFETTIMIIQCVHSHTAFTKEMLPIVDMSQMWPVLLGMLGMGALRSYDKAQGTASGH